ncbi:tetraspanin-4 [Sarotherodon galilaeus]
MENGEERPVAFVSRTLTEAEQKYAQIEKEALAIIFGVNKFHKYLYGRKFTLITDHKPLLAILGPKPAVPTLAALRMHRWGLILMAYNYDIEYRRSAEHANADALSRLPRNTPDNTAEEGSIFYFSHVEKLPIVAKDIERATMKDPILSKVWSYTMNGWPSYVQDKSLKPYFTRRQALSAEQGCFLWGQRVIILPVYRQKVLEDLNHEHPGICRMKALAHSYLWCPGCDSDIQELVQSCSVCQTVQKSPPAAPLHPWKWPERVWQPIHFDFAQKDKQYFLVVTESHSKWLEVFSMSSITSHNTIEVLRRLFASYGLPEELVSDDGPQLVSKQFNQFLELNGIRCTAVPAYHPASNGAVLRSNVLEADGKATLPLSHRLADFLIMYRSTPHTVTGRTPAELFLKHQIQTRFSLLKPELTRHIEQKQSEQKQHHDDRTQPVRVFSEGDAVCIRNFRGGDYGLCCSRDTTKSTWDFNITPLTC